MDAVRQSFGSGRNCRIGWHPSRRSAVCPTVIAPAGASFEGLGVMTPQGNPAQSPARGIPKQGNQKQGNPRRSSERGSGTVLAAGLGLVVMMAMALLLLLAQSAVMASRAAAAADLAALAAADALRGISLGAPCSVAADVAAQQGATLTSCTEGGGETVEVRTELVARTMLGSATGHARAGPPP
jgi:secretion/DNA translocation related TadE-like protein